MNTKYIFTIIFTLVLGNILDAQSNTFPSSGNVGIGTTTPSALLNVFKGDFRINVAGASSQKIAFREDGDSVDSFYLKSNMTGSGDGNLFQIGSEVSGVTALSIRRDSGHIGIGTTNPTQPLSVNGTIQAKEVIVETGWSDFVFEDSYRLRPLEEVESHIKEHGHLPDIPSAAIIESEGLSVGETQKIMMQKIEELTLYMIDLKKENDALRAEIEKLTTN